MIFHVLRPAAVAFLGQGTETGAPCVVASACFALIRRWRDTFPLEGEGYYARCDALGGTS